MRNSRNSLGLLLLMVGYLATLTCVLLLVSGARERALSDFENLDAQRQWDEWRGAAEQQSGGGPVQRRKPRSAEMPTLVLLRDYFSVVVAAAVVFTTALYAVLAIVFRGAFAETSPRRSD